MEIIKKNQVKVGIIIIILTIAVVGVMFFLKIGNSRKAPLKTTSREHKFMWIGENNGHPERIYIKAINIQKYQWTNYKEIIYKSTHRINSIAQVVICFLKGPRQGPIQVPVPRGLKLNDLYFLSNGALVLDFRIPEQLRSHIGLWESFLITQGITMTLKKNFKAIKKVRFLVNGKLTNTFPGHYVIKTSF